MGAQQKRARDPGARRRALAEAALEVIAEVGIGRTTHRAVALRAGLPLGATTYYFPTLDDLIGAALQHAAEELRVELDGWAERLGGADDVPAELTGLVQGYLGDRRRVQVEYELYVAAARDPRLRPLARGWLDGMGRMLEPYAGGAAGDVVALVDGVILQAMVTGSDVDGDRLTAAVRRLIADEA
ncbi:TetR/AcrR family transcriptional regulator [Winogradskya consettensis]|uniref:DNA-binding transcriptional regulator n=1 Tax=Winogradskya consettensis TaxID=113560 RepID=A0A919VMC2_9ACTN|nr:TetR family transcriptional regulator [Actinoplanes consettensis]GIM68836.1 DNA-binding transcriptional regulator [Actinoplanes consettensis]